MTSRNLVLSSDQRASGKWSSYFSLGLPFVLPHYVKPIRKSNILILHQSMISPVLQASFLSSHCLSSSWQPFFNEQCFTDDMYMVQNKGNWIKELYTCNNTILMKSYAQLNGHET